MVEGKRVAVVIPAYNEETLVGVTVAGIPEYVDRIYVVDDHSTDGTVAAVRQLHDPRLELIVREKNGGVGAAIVTGYKRAIEERIDVTAVMAADNKMTAADVIALVDPDARVELGYANARLFTGKAWDEIPLRYLGNAVLSMLTNQRRLLARRRLPVGFTAIS
jgi:glycosyltransferase involved in cell wall biosynthesis